MEFATMVDYVEWFVRKRCACPVGCWNSINENSSRCRIEKRWASFERGKEICLPLQKNAWIIDFFSRAVHLVWRGSVCGTRKSEAFSDWHSKKKKASRKTKKKWKTKKLLLQRKRTAQTYRHMHRNTYRRNHHTNNVIMIMVERLTQGPGGITNAQGMSVFCIPYSVLCARGSLRWREDMVWYFVYSATAWQSFAHPTLSISLSDTFLPEWPQPNGFLLPPPSNSTTSSSPSVLPQRRMKPSAIANEPLFLFFFFYVMVIFLFGRPTLGLAWLGSPSPPSDGSAIRVRHTFNRWEKVKICELL